MKPFTYLRQWHDRYGDVVALAEGDPSSVIAFGPAFNFQLLSNPDLFGVSKDVIVKIPEDTAFGRLMLNNLTMMNGEKHRQQRHLMQPAFHRHAVALYRDDMVAFTERLLERWQGKETPVNIHRAMQQLTQQIALKTLLEGMTRRSCSALGH